MGGSDWSFSLRKFDPATFSDSDSEDEGKQAYPSPAKETAESFDLSAREDTASYKPNPFSIAKINAACRSRSAKEGEEMQASKLKLTGPKRPAAPTKVQVKRRPSAAKTGNRRVKESEPRSANQPAIPKSVLSTHREGSAVLPQRKFIADCRSEEQMAPTSKPVHTMTVERDDDCRAVSFPIGPAVAAQSAPPLPLPFVQRQRGGENLPNTRTNSHLPVVKRPQMQEFSEMPRPASNAAHISSPRGAQAGISVDCERTEFHSLLESRRFTRSIAYTDSSAAYYSPVVDFSSSRLQQAASVCSPTLLQFTSPPTVLILARCR
ncbi:hypothetical protein NMY22_g14159 [Coprinellus aureogranulatus]|nr:hypothetical protein NMY22_g14159 [Coprinellus aureogranulatus]